MNHLHAENNYTVGRVIFACLNFRESVFGIFRSVFDSQNLKVRSQFISALNKN